jgi:hypothetical protein
LSNWGILIYQEDYERLREKERDEKERKRERDCSSLSDVRTKHPAMGGH